MCLVQGKGCYFRGYECKLIFLLPNTGITIMLNLNQFCMKIPKRFKGY